jgi:hypothetical protein
MLNIVEPQLSIIRLTNSERQEFQRAESEIGETLNAFLRCGAALSVIRNKRLYREGYPSFEAYVRERWGMSEGAAGALLTNYHIAKELEELGIKLPLAVTQSSMKALSRVPRLEGLRATVWQYALGLAPSASCPPLSLLRKITSTVREALSSDGEWEGEGASVGDDEVDGAGNRVLEEGGEEPCGRPEGNKKAPVCDQRFLRSVTRLAGYSGFSVPLVVSQVGSERMAGYVWRSCERLKGRLEEVEVAILKQFPDVRNQKT